jgi:prophage antirepressor-like protein
MADSNCNIISVQFKSSIVRTFIDELGNTWFCSKDSCDILGYTNNNKAVKDHCRAEGITNRDTPTEGGVQSMTYINEGNLYRLIARSKKKEAERFEVWIFDEVLPQIRKTGTYRPKSFIEDVVDGMKRNEIKLLGFTQMPLNDRNAMKTLQWNLQQSLGLTAKKMMKRRIDMRAPLNLLINGMSSGEFRRRIGLQQEHKDINRRPMKTCDFLPEPNQYALYRTDLLLSEFLRTNDFDVTYQEACDWYRRYGEIAKGEAERKYQVNLHDSVAQSIRMILGFVAEQMNQDVSPYHTVEQHIKRVTCQSIKRRPIAQAA